MCGLLGFASTENMNGREVRRNFLRTGFPMIALDRGIQSSGLALVERTDPDPIVFKRALWGGDYIQQWQTGAYLSDIEKYTVAIGHVRASTRGAVTDYNAHPFKYDHITLVHNGHIKNASELPGVSDAKCHVDSAQVAYSMAHNGEKETLEAVQGGFVFIWWNSKTQKLNIARNLARPLFMAYAAKENSMFWASELTHVLHLLRNTEIDGNGCKFPEEHIWYQYDLKNLRSYEKVPFVPSQGRRIIGGQSSTTTGSAGGTGNSIQGCTEEEWKEWERSIEERNTRLTQAASRRHYYSNHQTGATEATSEVDEIRDQVRQQRLKQIKHHGVPTSEKRLARAKDLLRELGLTYEQGIVMHPKTWAKYHNQTHLGSLIGHSKTIDCPIEVIGVSSTKMADFYDVKFLLVDCRNVRYGNDNKKRVIATVNPKMEEIIRHKKERKKEQKENTDTEETKESLGSIDRDYDGPGGQKVTRARFLELVTHGCSNCQREISEKEHGTVIWVGTPASPVCHDCNTVEIMESLGFPNHLRLVH